MARAATAELLAPLDEPALDTARPRPRAATSGHDRKVYDWSQIRNILVDEPVKAIAPQPEMLFYFAD